MAQQIPPKDGYLGDPKNLTHGREKDDIPSDQSERKISSAPAYQDSHDNQTGEIYDPYGGKKIGMVRVCEYRLDL
jgi:hypothetical protein